MVQTRRQYNRWVQERGPDYETSQSEDQCEECSQQSNNSFEFNDSPVESEQRRGPSYGPNDACKRHRRPDDDPYSEIVTSYRRRKPQT